jgi:hypothetical protein
MIIHAVLKANVKKSKFGSIMAKINSNNILARARKEYVLVMQRIIDQDILTCK